MNNKQYKSIKRYGAVLLITAVLIAGYPIKGYSAESAMDSAGTSAETVTDNPTPSDKIVANDGTAGDQNLAVDANAADNASPDGSGTATDSQTGETGDAGASGGSGNSAATGATGSEASDAGKGTADSFGNTDAGSNATDAGDASSDNSGNTGNAQTGSNSGDSGSTQSGNESGNKVSSNSGDNSSNTNNDGNSTESDQTAGTTEGTDPSGNTEGENTPEGTESTGGASGEDKTDIVQMLLETEPVSETEEADSEKRDDVLQVVLPTTSESGKSPFDFLIDPQRLVYLTDAIVYGGGTVEEDATLLFHNHNGEYDYSSRSDYVSVTNSGETRTSITISANLDNLGDIEIAEDDDFSDDTACTIYMSIVDDEGNETPITPGQDATITVSVEAGESYSFGLRGAVNPNVDWLGDNFHPVIRLNWGIEKE